MGEEPLVSEAQCHPDPGLYMRRVDGVKVTRLTLGGLLRCLVECSRCMGNRGDPNRKAPGPCGEACPRSGSEEDMPREDVRTELRRLGSRRTVE